jgi:hypothetical protein
MNDSSRTQGGLICGAVAILALLFLGGLLRESYWAVAIPVAVLTFFVLGLAFWVGWTILTIQVEPEPPVDAPAEPPPAEAAPPSEAPTG